MCYGNFGGVRDRDYFCIQREAEIPVIFGKRSQLIKLILLQWFFLHLNFLKYSCFWLTSLLRRKKMVSKMIQYDLMGRIANGRPHSWIQLLNTSLPLPWKSANGAEEFCSGFKQRVLHLQKSQIVSDHLLSSSSSLVFVFLMVIWCYLIVIFYCFFWWLFSLVATSHHYYRRDSFRMRSLDGVLSFFEQESFAFSRMLTSNFLSRASVFASKFHGVYHWFFLLFFFVIFFW